MLIDKDDVDASVCRSELGSDTVSCLLRDRRKPAGERLFALMKVDREPGGLDRAEMQPGIVPAGGHGGLTGAGEDERGSHQGSDERPHEPELLPPV